MRYLVTGAAGFIGSHLAEALVDRGHEVTGIDCLTDVYDPALKRRNVDALVPDRGFEFVEADIRDWPLRDAVEDVDAVFHLAAIPGVRASWAEGFSKYLSHNVLGTQRVLEAARDTGTRVVYASSSSVYGNALTYPTFEDDLKRPHSPYGVTKLTAEHLCDTYADAFGVHTVALRYFSVFGSRQRPDMGVHRIIESALEGSEFTLYGDGSQVRDMTYVGDVVRATLAAVEHDVPSNAVMNIAGGSQVTVRELIDVVGEIVGSPVNVRRGPQQPGDVRRTAGDVTRAAEILDWRPQVELRDGLAQQVEWHIARGTDA